MKNFKYYLFATAALLFGFAMGACTPDEPVNQGTEAKASVVVASVGSSSATLNVVTTGVTDFAYIMNESELPATAIFGAGTTVSLEDATVETTTEVVVNRLESETT